jgi:hypothetical protein
MDQLQQIISVLSSGADILSTGSSAASEILSLIQSVQNVLPH